MPLCAGAIAQSGGGKALCFYLADKKVLQMTDKTHKT
jgi:hypothetical protein